MLLKVPRKRKLIMGEIMEQKLKKEKIERNTESLEKDAGSLITGNREERKFSHFVIG